MSLLKIKDSLLDGYTFPFEGNPHKGTIIALPYRKDTWREDALPALENFYNLVKIISQYEKVYLLVDPSISEEKYSRFKMENVTMLFIPYNDLAFLCCHAP